jgi:hypothetical protein
MKDQYNNKVPTDLVVLPIGELSNEDVEKVLNADWYKANDWLLCASAKEIDYLTEFPIEEALTKRQLNSVEYVPQILHRYTPEDWFYHA